MISMPRRALSGLVIACGIAWGVTASAQMGGMGGGGMQGGGYGGGMGGRGGQQQQQSHTQSSPTKSNTVGPRNPEPTQEDEEEEVRSQVTQRTEPSLPLPANPLAISPELHARIGSDAEGATPSPYGSLRRSFFPYYEESRGDYRFRMVPPLWLEHTRGLPTEAGSGCLTGGPGFPSLGSPGSVISRRRDPLNGRRRSRD